MKRALKASVTSICAVFLAATAHPAQAAINVWTSNGPPGGDVFTLAIDPITPSTLYAGTHGTSGIEGSSLFKSTDGGQTWGATGLTYPLVYALAIDPITPSTLYAGAGGGVIFKSTDGGTTWGAAHAGATDVYALAIDRLTPRTLYAGGGGVYKSTDAGATWSAINAALTQFNVRALAIDPITPRTLYAGTDDSVFKSTDGGATWAAFNTGLTNTRVHVVAIDPITPSTLYAGTEHYGRGVFKSTDAGATWAALNTDLTNTFVNALAIDPSMPNTLYAGVSYGGVFKSTDAGARWRATALPLSNVLTLAIDPITPSTLYAATGSPGVFKSTDAGATWGQTIAYFPSAIDPRTPSTLYAGTSAGIFKSTDGAMSWQAANTGLPATNSTALAIDPTTPGTLYAGIVLNCDPEGGCTGGGVFKSTDGASSWQAVNAGLPNNSIVTTLAIDPTTPGTLYAVTYGGVFKSTDAGATWSAVGPGLPDGYGIGVLAIDPSTPSTLYAGTYGDGVFKSTDAGAIWNALNTGLTNPNVRALAIDPIIPGTLYAGTYGGGVFSIQQAPSACTGDCDASGNVTVDDIITLVNIALGTAQPSACRQGVPNNAAVDIALIIQAVSNALNGCPSSDLYVAASGALSGDGSLSNPYRRITDAVARARAQRASGAIPAEETIQIHVAPGTYIGSFNSTQLQNHSEYEVLPIILNVPGLAVRGATVLVRDARGLPTASAPESETILAPDMPLVPDQALFLVTRTADGAVGNRVTVEGFVLDAGEGGGESWTHAVFVDGVSDFRISNNLTRRASFGVSTRLASGTIEGNLLIDHFRAGTNVTGGSLAQPATILIHANRATGNGEHGLMNFAAAAVLLPISAGSNTLQLEPLQTTFDRNDPQDLQNIPDTLAVTLTDNDSSNNHSLGIRLYANGFLGYQTLNRTQALTAGLTANVLGNTCRGNGQYGVAMEPGFPSRSDLRRFVLTFAGSFEGNSFGGNGRAAALFDFTRWDVSVGIDSPQNWKFVQESTYEVTDTDGELTGFDYDHPVMDPLVGTVLNNTLTLNGVEVPHGTRITPESIEPPGEASVAR